MAIEWLERNKLNRPLNHHRVRRYAEDMNSGDWTVTGDAIRFSKSGKLLDGQHRLWACVESGKSFSTVVYTGLPEEAQLVMDQGMARSRGSQLILMGHKRGRDLASACLAFWRMENGRKKILARAGAPSNSEIFHILHENPDIEQCLTRFFAIKSQSGVRTQKGAMIALYVYMRRFSPLMADAFIEEYLTGVNLEPGSPTLALRERILQYRLKGWKILHSDFITWAGYAWRAYVKNAKMKRISCRNQLPEFPGSPPWDLMAAREATAESQSSEE
jgi:hypothetical protein